MGGCCDARDLRLGRLEAEVRLLKNASYDAIYRRIISGINKIDNCYAHAHLVVGLFKLVLFVL